MTNNNTSRSTALSPKSPPRRRRSKVLCPTCYEPQREQSYQLEPLDGPPTNSIHTDYDDDGSASEPEGEETSASQTSTSQQQEHEEEVRDLEQQIIDLKMDLAEEKDRNGHVTQSKVDLERELSEAQKSHGALLVESTQHKFDAQNSSRENESLRAENARLRTEMEGMRRQRLHAGMVAVAQGTNTIDLNNASDGSLGDKLKDLFSIADRRRSTASTTASNTATTTSSTCPTRPAFKRADSGGFFRDLAADIEHRRSSLPSRPTSKSTPCLESFGEASSSRIRGRRSSTSDASSKDAAAYLAPGPTRRASLLMDQRNYQCDSSHNATFDTNDAKLHVVGETTWGKLKD